VLLSRFLRIRGSDFRPHTPPARGVASGLIIRCTRLERSVPFQWRKRECYKCLVIIEWGTSKSVKSLGHVKAIIANTGHGNAENNPDALAAGLTNYPFCRVNRQLSSARSVRTNSLCASCVRRLKVTQRESCQSSTNRIRHSPSQYL
jgi:hypothetical protein